MQDQKMYLSSTVSIGEKGAKIKKIVTWLSDNQIMDMQNYRSNPIFKGVILNNRNVIPDMEDDVQFKKDNPYGRVLTEKDFD
jgi:hypothetical protein